LILGNECLHITDLPAHLTVETLSADDEVQCHFCTQSTKLKNMRNHVGKHTILLAKHAKDGSDILKPGMIGVDPCGWCGRDGCKVQLTKKGNSHSISSSCPYQYSKMVYAWALKCTKASPCTNVPIHCPICLPGLSGQPRTLWKYNALFHFATEHAPVGQKLPAIPPELIVETFITSKEESLMGISQEDTQKWRDDNEIPNTDGLEQLKEEISAAKREQAESTVTQPPHKTPCRS